MLKEFYQVFGNLKTIIFFFFWSYTKSEAMWAITQTSNAAFTHNILSFNKKKHTNNTFNI